MMNRGTPPPPPYYADLLALADALVGEGRYELAVVVAQMACEVVVEQTLTPLLKGKNRPSTFNLEGGALAKYTLMTKDQIAEQTFWKPYVRHAKRRHDVVHFGGRLHPSDARDSTTTARQLVEHVHEVRRRPYDRAILAFVARTRLPTIYTTRHWIDVGGLMYYGPNAKEQWRRVAYYIDRILKGAKPDDLPVEQSARLDLVLNMRTARALRLDIAPSLVSRADEVVE